MSEEGPKLFTNKPKKAQIKQFQESPPPPSSTTTSSASYKMGSQSTAPPPPPPPQPPKESFARRYKFIWPLLLSVNLAAGAYLFLRTKKKDTEEEVVEDVPSTPVSSTPTTTTASVIEKHNPPPPPPAISEPVKPRKPVPENQQRELYKWMLEEKRKLKPKSPEEKKRIDEEKAVLKQFLRAKSVPTV